MWRILWFRQMPLTGGLRASLWTSPSWRHPSAKPSAKHTSSLATTSWPSLSFETGIRYSSRAPWRQGCADSDFDESTRPVVPALGTLGEAEPLLTESWQARSRLLGEDNAETVGYMTWLGLLYLYQATWLRMDETERLLTKVIM